MWVYDREDSKGFMVYDDASPDSAGCIARAIREEGDAKRIAATPKLIEALQKARRHIHTVGDRHFVEICEQALVAAGIELERIGQGLQTDKGAERLARIDAATHG